MTKELLGLIEVTLIGITAVVTVVAAVYVGRQANRHFLMQRSTSFIERFNTGDLRRIRPRVDQLLASPTDWEGEVSLLQKGELDEERRLLFYDLIVFTNFFQELATAFKHKTIEEDYTWDVFGALVRNYWIRLQPFVVAMRTVNERPLLYEGFEQLAGRMETIDDKRQRS